jgi:chromosome segregation ATPase
MTLRSDNPEAGNTVVRSRRAADSAKTAAVGRQDLRNSGFMGFMDSVQISLQGLHSRMERSENASSDAKEQLIRFEAVVSGLRDRVAEMESAFDFNQNSVGDRLDGMSRILDGLKEVDDARRVREDRADELKRKIWQDVLARGVQIGVGIVSLLLLYGLIRWLELNIGV